MHSAGDDVLFHPTMQHFKWRRGRGGWGGGRLGGAKRGSEWG